MHQIAVAGIRLQQCVSVLAEMVSPIEIALLQNCIDEHEIQQQKERLQKSLTDVSDCKTSNKRKV